MISVLLPSIFSIVDKLIPDKEAQAKAKLELLTLSQKGELKELEAVVSIVNAEAKSEHWVVAAWRPITMLVFVAIIANNYLLYPYLSIFWSNAPLLTLPSDLWGLLKIGLGGYVVGRSVEKATEAYRGKG
jgi:hypothetical protein